MPSMKNIVLGATLAGMATAFPQAGLYTNGTTTNGTTTSGGSAPLTSGTSSSSPVTESLFCPNLSGSIIRSKTGTSEFLLACNTNYFGIVIDVQFNSTIFNKRQAAVAPSNIQDCIAACDTVTGCVGTAFDTDAQTCALYGQIGAAYAADGIDFAIRVSTDAPTTISAGSEATSTIFSTNVVTISACAPTVTNCPLTAGAVGGAVTATEVIAVSSTQYICPTAVVAPVAPVACSCAYGSSTATVYTVSGTTVVPVETKVVAVPSPSGTTVSTTTVQGTGAAVTTAPMTVAGSATTSSGLASYTGGASNVKAAGAGMAGLMAAAAFIL